MKKLILLLSIIGLSLSSCQDSESEVPMQISEIIKKWDDDMVSITVNGKKLPKQGGRSYTVEILYLPEAGMGDQLFLKGSGMGGIMEPQEGIFDVAMAYVPIDINSQTADRITFSGSGPVLNMGLGMFVEGVVYLDNDTDLTPRIQITVNYKNTLDFLSGRTFEIDFTDTSLYPEFIPGIEKVAPVEYKGGFISASSLINIVFEDIKHRYVNSMGIDRARIKFNDVPSYELWFHYTGCDSFVKDEAEHYCYYNDNRIYFLDEESFVINEGKHFIDDPYCIEHNLPHYMLCTVLIEWKNNVYGLMGLNYEIDGDNLIMRYNYSYSPFVAKIYCDHTPMDYYKARSLDKYFTPKAVFTEVK